MHLVSPAHERRVIFLVLPLVHLMDLGGMAQVFSEANDLGARYHLMFCGPQPQVTSAQGLHLANLEALPALRPGDQVIVPAVRTATLMGGRRVLTPELHAWLSGALGLGAQIAAVCSASLLLAEAGLLNGRQCTAHWELFGELRHRAPGARVQEGMLYVQDGPLTTSAGMASGLDLALSLLERDLGPLSAAQVARQMVVYLRRSGNTSQASVYLEFRTHLHAGVHRVQDYLTQHAHENPSLEELARVANMSVRSLTRAFKTATGLTPNRYAQRLRLERARSLMFDPRLTLEAIAVRCGFEDARHFRRLWRETYGESPSLSRERLGREAQRQAV
ncbi:transcriptional regulator GlxA family with amidase domain [Deinobacterium chartae]|uniref:Transcriptional regulator GlxA family with amidase domain n=1 Tax=Deinobacterium chartae TaxID=521158 RepID=A0A841HZQ3_9DEIO|nr:helix-turn-helix domain-containing protein [Deinobacterium chartae]MBB6097488.1 transcriptional regulator GlxA family with amidase domain [Deinobacterium chartae]